MRCRCRLPFAGHHAGAAADVAFRDRAGLGRIERAEHMFGFRHVVPRCRSKCIGRFRHHRQRKDFFLIGSGRKVPVAPGDDCIPDYAYGIGVGQQNRRPSSPDSLTQWLPVSSPFVLTDHSSDAARTRLLAARQDRATPVRIGPFPVTSGPVPLCRVTSDRDARNIGNRIPRTRVPSNGMPRLRAAVFDLFRRGTLVLAIGVDRRK